MLAARTTIESPAGYHETLDPPASYVVEPETQPEQPPIDTPEGPSPVEELREVIRNLTDPAEGAKLAAQAEDFGLLGVLEDKIKALQFKRGQGRK
jgi:hypothetical protein